ncbi:MAG: Bax inhibitor-1/YccA family protein [Candidatus Limnocylindrales bacterium]
MINNDPRRPDPTRASPSTGPVNQTGWAKPNTLSTMGQPAAATVATGEGFLTMSFVWMTLGLLLSAGTAAVVLSSANILTTVTDWYLGLIMVEFAFVIAVSAAINKVGALPGLALFFAFAILNGATLSILALVYTSASITAAFVGASAVFGAAAVYGVVTRRDLTSLGGILFVGLIGLVVMSLANIWIGGSAFSFVIGALGIVIFTGLTAYDVQRLRNGNLAWIATREAASVIGALRLYLDFVNLFISFLRVSGGRR